MQIFLPYKEPLLVAKCLDKRRLNKQIIECQQILNAIDNKSTAWKNHPVIKMYKDSRRFLLAYYACLSSYVSNDNISAEEYNKIALKHLPEFITEEFCTQHRSRLYTKAPELYPQFAEYGISYENWYIVDGKLIKYKNGLKL